MTCAPLPQMPVYMYIWGGVDHFWNFIEFYHILGMVWGVVCEAVEAGFAKHLAPDACIYVYMGWGRSLLEFHRILSYFRDGLGGGVRTGGGRFCEAPGPRCLYICIYGVG